MPTMEPGGSLMFRYIAIVESLEMSTAGVRS